MAALLMPAVLSGALALAAPHATPVSVDGAPSPSEPRADLRPVVVAALPAFAQGAPAASGEQPAKGEFVHPGGLHTRADLDRMRTRVAAGDHPWIDGWNKLLDDPKARDTYRAAPKPTMPSRQRAQDDAMAAYLNALRWCISGDTKHADCAVRILNDWSATVDQVIPEGGLSGIPVGTFAVAGEVLRGYPGWAGKDRARFAHMLRAFMYPACHDFLTHHNGRGDSAFWANWDAANILSLVAIGVFCDDRPIFDEGVTYFKNGKGMGSIMHAVPFLYPGGLGQWQESGRDHAHALGGIGLLAETCQVAWNQGVDLFSYAHNRLLAGAEYEAQFTQWVGVPYTYYTNCDDANQYYVSENYHGRLGNCQAYELLYNHYVVRKGLAAPNVKRFAELLRPEAGNVDIAGYGTLAYTLDAAASPYPASPTPPVPQDLAATAGVGRVSLQWSPSGAYSTQGYEVSRATRSGGPYTSIYSTTGWTTPRFTDTKVENGTTYYYVVAAINQSGTSARSPEVSATPAAAGDLPAGWAGADLGSPAVPGRATYADVSGGTFVVSGGGHGIGGKADGGHFAYRSVTGDFTITARLTEAAGTVDKVGLMMRAATAANAPTLAMTLGGRQARFGTRPSAGGGWTVQRGDDYTWMPVWFRLRRSGDTFTAFQSSDGATWFKVGTSTVPMPPTYLVGMAASSGGDKGEPATALFDNVSVEVAPPPPPAAPGRLTAVPDRDTVKLTWTNEATNPRGVKVECSRDGLLFYEVADLGAGATRFVNTGLASRPYHYRVRAYNTGGYSPYSNTASNTPAAQASPKANAGLLTGR